MPLVELDRDRLQQTLVCLLSKRSMAKVRLHKMLYLVERDAAVRTGRLAIGIRFKNHNYGMFSPPLADQIDSLVGSGFLQSRVIPADSGEGRAYRLGPTSQGVEVSDMIRSTCDGVLEEYRSAILEGPDNQGEGH